MASNLLRRREMTFFPYMTIRLEVLEWRSSCSRSRIWRLVLSRRAIISDSVILASVQQKDCHGQIRFYTLYTTKKNDNLPCPSSFLTKFFISPLKQLRVDSDDFFVMSVITITSEKSIRNLDNIAAILVKKKTCFHAYRFKRIK